MIAKSWTQLSKLDWTELSPVMGTQQALHASGQIRYRWWGSRADWSPLTRPLVRQHWRDTSGSLVLGLNSCPWYGQSSRAPDTLSPRDSSSKGSWECGALLKSFLGILAQSHMIREESHDQGWRLHFYVCCTLGIRPSWPSPQGTILTWTYPWLSPWSDLSTWPSIGLQAI